MTPQKDAEVQDSVETSGTSENDFPLADLDARTLDKVSDLLEEADRNGG